MERRCQHKAGYSAGQAFAAMMASERLSRGSTSRCDQEGSSSPDSSHSGDEVSEIGCLMT